jgi:Arm DNA-binding domain
MAKLTKRIVDAASPREAAYFLWCSELSGFGVRVHPTGKRVYYADYRNKQGVRKRLAIGPHGKLTTEEARARIQRHILPLLGAKRVCELTRADISKFIMDVTTGKTALVEKTGLRGKAIVRGGAGTAYSCR